MIDLFDRWRVRYGSPRGRDRGWVGHAICAGIAACVSILATPAHADDITYGYDALGRLTSVSVGGSAAYYDYDPAGNITAIRRQVSVSSASSIGQTALTSSPRGEVSAASIASTLVSR
ncbi:RHS repeat domain-containing protein [Paraburkholderia sp. MPAMCS5]|nr:RHS repeat domain-containing protein [Paraburkholderia sp. MPAMCS5]